jgi:hypothetical protein
VDRYRSPLVSELAGCARDAEAIYALFNGTFGQESMVLLTNDLATRPAIWINSRSFSARRSKPMPR